MLQANTTEIIAETSVTSTDSVKKTVQPKYLRAEPNTFRTPTSFARFDERAVDRFMKLTQAISSIKYRHQRKNIDILDITLFFQRILRLPNPSNGYSAMGLK